jgi:hypothetical protein
MATGQNHKATKRDGIDSVVAQPRSLALGMHLFYPFTPEEMAPNIRVLGAIKRFRGTVSIEGGGEES